MIEKLELISMIVVMPLAIALVFILNLIGETQQEVG